MSTDLPEVATLTQAAELMASVQGDALRCAELLASIRVTTDAELRERWKPIIEEGIAQLGEASLVLTKARTRMQTPSSGWASSSPDHSTITALVTVSRALTDLLARLESAKADTGARDLFVRIRSKLNGKLPSAERAAARRTAIESQARPRLGLRGALALEGFDG